MRTDLAPFLAWTQAQGIQTPLKLTVQKTVRSLSSPVSNDAPPGFCPDAPLQLLTEDYYRCMTLPSSAEKNNDFVLPTSSSAPSDDTTTTTIAYSNNLIQVPLDACIVDSDSLALAERLLHEKKKLGTQSKFAPYLDVLPTLEDGDFADMPRFWTPERRELIRLFDGGQLEEFMALQQVRFDTFLGGSTTDHQWALACVDSRSNILPDQENSYSLTPLLDMFNHDSRVPTQTYINDSNQFLLNVGGDSFDLSSSSETIIKKEEEAEGWADKVWNLFGSGGGDTGDQSSRSRTSSNREVFISYGNLNNIQTLCNYGFISTNNPQNTETFTVRLMARPPVSLLVDEKGAVDNIMNNMVFNDLRKSLASADEIDTLKMQESLDDGKISERNEKEVYALIAGELEEAIQEAKIGVRATKEIGDDMAAAYLAGRQTTLEKARNRIGKAYPALSD